MPDTSPTLGLPYLAPAQAQKHVTVNEALKRLDVLAQLAVEAFGATTPPASPADGQVWALGPSPTGAWAGRDGQLAAWLDGGWEFIAPQAGWRAYGRADQSLRSHDGSGWLAVQGAAPNLTNLSELGVNAAPDATNRLAVGAAGSLFTHDGSDHRMVLNKAAAADTGSILWQTGFSGRAEVGLTGDDALSFKVSPDGAAWTTALSLSGTGAAGFAGDITAAGALSVTGDIAGSGALTVTGALEAGPLTVNGAIAAGGSVTATGQITGNGGLFTGAATQQVAVNKAAPADTGSVLFQTGFSGRAEIGLAGGDDLSLKVSPDGAAWTTALRLRAADAVTEIAEAEVAGGIALGGTGAAHRLTHYEEGSYTPNFIDMSGNASSAGVTVRFIRVGSKVTIFFDDILNVVTTGLVGGNPAALDLPFTAGSAAYAAVELRNMSAGTGPYMLWVRAADNYARFREALTNSNVKVSDFNSGASDILGATLTLSLV